MADVSTSTRQIQRKLPVGNVLAVKQWFNGHKGMQESHWQMNNSVLLLLKVPHVPGSGSCH